MTTLDTRSPHRPGSALRGAWPIALTELRLIARNRTVLFSASLFPLAFGAYFVAQRDATANAAIAVTGLLALFFAQFTIYATVTSTLVARREDLYLKRLRSGETSDTAILLGLFAPPIALCAAQLALVLGTAYAIGVARPDDPVPALLAVVGIFAVCTGMAALTAVLTPNASAAQITSMPFLVVLMGSFIGSAVLENRFWDLTPGGAVVTLVRIGYGADTAGTYLTAVAGLALWAWCGYALARRRFRWEPRS